MPLPPSLNLLIPLLAGLAIGGIGATMFLQSLPGPEGSSEERATKLEVELKQAVNRIAKMEAENPDGRQRTRRTLADGARRIGEDIRAGRPVSPDDIFRASQPLLRDLAPLFDRMRVRQQQDMIESKTGELARKYLLTPRQQDELKSWFETKGNEEGKRWNDLVASDNTRLEDLVQAARDVRPYDGLDQFMARQLRGEKLAAFQAERMDERAQAVQQEADQRVQRLDAIVGLDERQRDQVFDIIARSSRDYDPSMQIHGVTGEIAAAPAANRRANLLTILRPDQRRAFEAEQQRRRTEAAKDLETMGLTLPEGWEFFDEGAFH
ncbi:MAG: hypothetical protein WC076_00870 [Terrimicrobiaceae bacterium]